MTAITWWNSDLAVVTGYTLDSNDTTTAVSDNYTKKAVVAALAYASPLAALHVYHIVFLSAAIALGVPGNLLVVIVYAAVRRKIACDWYVMYIGVLDLVVCLFRVPTHLAMETGYWQKHSSDALCKLVYWISQSIITASVILFGFIAVDRYIKICRTTIHLSLRFCVRCVAAISVASVLSATPTFWIYTSNGQGNCGSTSTLLGAAMTRAYYSFVFGVFILMFAVVVFSYTLIIVRVRQSRNILKAHEARGARRAHGKSRVTRRENRVGVAGGQDEANGFGTSCDGEHSSQLSDGVGTKLWTTRAPLSLAPKKDGDAERLSAVPQVESAYRRHLVARGPTSGVEMEAERNGNDVSTLNENVMSCSTARDSLGDQREATLSPQLAGNGDSLAETPPQARDGQTDRDMVHVTNAAPRRNAVGNGLHLVLKVPEQTTSRNNSAVPSFKIKSDSELSESAMPSVTSSSQDGGYSEVTSGGRRLHGQNASRTTASSSTKGDLDSRNLRLTLLLLVMTVIFVGSWIPPYVAMVWYFYVGNTSPFSVSELSLMAYAPTGYILNHFANPFVYLFLSSSFRRHLVALWRKLKSVVC